MAETRTGTRKRIGDLLLKAGVIKPEHLPAGLAEADKFQLRLGEMLVMLRFMSTEDLSNVLQAQQMLDNGQIDEELAVAALKQASEEKLEFEDAIDRVKQLESSSLEFKKNRINKLLSEISEKERSSGALHRDIAPSCLELGDLFEQMAQDEDAEKQFKRAFLITENSYGKTNLKLAVPLARLIDLNLLQMKFADAEPLAWRLIQICQEHLGADDIETAKAFHRLARVLENSGRLVEAEQFYLSALRVKEKKYGPDHPEMIDQLRQMASFWSKQGRKAEKKRIGDILVEAGLLNAAQMQEAAQSAQKLGIPLGQYLLTSDAIDAEVVRAGLQAQLLIGDGVVPAELAIKALRICAKQNIALDEALEHIGWQPETLSTTELKTLIGDADSLITAERTLGTNHCGVAIICMRLGDSYMSQNRYVEAETNYKRAVGILEKFFGPKDIEVAQGLFKLAELFAKQNKHVEAESYIWRTLEIQQKGLGADHIDVATTLELLADLKSKQSNPEQAEMFFKSALAIKEKLYGAESLKLVSLLEKAADIYGRLDKSEESVPYYVRMVKIKQKHGEKQPLEAAKLLDKLGKHYEKKGELESACAQFELALEIYEANYSPEHPEILPTLERCAAILRKLEKLNEAENLEARAGKIRSSSGQA
ncbi:MAG: tetratricopeptide repeat protein [Candidatus Obscuribacterales bacterium]|nr:tetratricopeptide repeat protein [Candidatus Obscuribacterales bacterium]